MFSSRRSAVTVIVSSLPVSVFAAGLDSVLCANADGAANMAASVNPQASERGEHATAMIFFFMDKPLMK